MSRLTGWWVRRSAAGKVELYTRWTFHFFVLVEITSIGGVPIGQTDRDPLGLPLAAGLAVFVCTHAVLNGVLSSRALDWVLDRRERPVRLAVAQVALTAAGVLTLIALRATGVLANGAIAAGVITGTITFTLGSLVMCLKRVRHMLCAAPLAALTTGAAVAAMDVGVPEALGYTLGILLGGGGLVAACGFSAWLMKMVWELERTKELKARLAVAEERLRFGRDLHDVMGRNLSVIALKSELAVQLARRERPEAVDQMIEVQRIAQESQREVRDVVRGYREADLRVELEGARGVLSAAGIACAMESDMGSGMDAGLCSGLGAGLGAGDDGLPSEVQSALGWVVRETTTNVLRHGDPSRCAISLRRKDDAVVLTVENDGVRETPGPRAGGSGLAGLRERLSAVDGTLTAGPGDGGTFLVTARVPVPRRGKAA
ncbi:sensor histidine kinase [Streptomyces sp. QHH-9511]|uniref:sensor histidine kinase n=1 Tax=Streptomyces sp. QHH-9511 TaxID=2684468 RepID=UPI001316D97C|nr:histidine kinase [Streptomyces sp. QHH-9511]QGZ50048.1 sensor histidine kinase [Streptomyces sp. QHH-9511]